MAGRAKPRRPRVFDRDAGRWKFGMRAAAAGQLVQMDHMSVSFPGATVKNFPVPDHRPPHPCATSHNAAHFLEQVLDTMLFAVHSIQVGGGSELKRRLRAGLPTTRYRPVCTAAQGPQAGRLRGMRPRTA